MRALMRPPSVHQLAEDADLRNACEEHGRPAVVQAAREVIEQERSETADWSRARLVELVRTSLDASRPLYQEVINATGVLLHTNLGRAPLSLEICKDALGALGYCDLELELATGERASRHRTLALELAQWTTAEAAHVVNNNAAAVLLAVTALAKGRPTAISRGQLVEIGGGFRLPEVITTSGSALLEVGTTNRTRLDDYRQALDLGAGLVLVVHRSNFAMRGYVGEPEHHELVTLAHGRGVPIVLDLGSGCALDTSRYGLPKEPTIQDAAAQGFDIVCSSADKLLGGVQAGIMLGKQSAIATAHRHPLARALRCDKLQLALLYGVVRAYRTQRAERVLPLWRMLGVSAATLRTRVEAWASATGRGSVSNAVGAIGGGALPEAELLSPALCLDAPHAQDASVLSRLLRLGSPPVVTQVKHDQVLLHARTVLPEQDELMVQALRTLSV